jgi:hypothetical protein
MTTLFRKWMRVSGDVVLAVGALLTARDFIIKLRPLYPRLARVFSCRLQFAPERLFTEASVRLLKRRDLWIRRL